MKSLSSILILCTTIVLVHSEPPVSNQYLPPQNIPSTSYGAPQQTYGAPQQNSYNRNGNGGGGGGGFSTAYGAPAITSAIFPKPSTSYGAPSGQRNGYSNGYSNGAGGNRGGYGGVNGGGGGGNGGYSYGNGGGDENYGPAKYEFQYDVQDYQTGQDFGHMESRDGDRTVGRYYVLLPDGRKQIVNYEADENGYRPTITYEETNNGNGGGYNRNAQPFNGY